MPSLRTYNLFISHAWMYDYEYSKVIEFLDSVANFKWKNFSVPWHNPKIDPNSKSGEQRLKRELENQLKPVNCVLVIGGIYVSHRFWIQMEMSLANNFDKPIIGIMPRGSLNIPTAVRAVCRYVVGWNRFSIVEAVRNYSF